MFLQFVSYYKVKQKIKKAGMEKGVNMKGTNVKEAQLVRKKETAKKKVITKAIPTVLCAAVICVLASCAAVPDSTERDGIKVAVGGTLDGGTGDDSGNKMDSDATLEDQAWKEKDASGYNGGKAGFGAEESGAEESGAVKSGAVESGMEGDSIKGSGAEGSGAEKADNAGRDRTDGGQSFSYEKTPEEQSAEILTAAAGTKIERTIQRTDGKRLRIDAGVNTESVKGVSRYKYILQPITDEIRQSLFQSVFATRTSEMEYDERNDVWELRNSSQAGDYWLYQISFSNGGATIPGEEIIMLEYRYYDLYPFEDNRLKAVSDSKADVSADETAESCGKIVEALMEGLRQATATATEECTQVAEEFAVDYIHAYGNSGRRPYYKIVFKRMLDGMPVTTYNNLSFLYDNEGLEKVWGSLFSVEEMGLESPILTVEEAVDSLERQAAYINFEEKTQISVSEITPEYITLMTPTGDIQIVPVWRFRLGEDADERNFLREKILAINAVTGDLIWEERGNTF